MYMAQMRLVTITAHVEETICSREGQVTFRSSARTSRKNLVTFSHIRTTTDL